MAFQASNSCNATPSVVPATSTAMAAGVVNGIAMKRPPSFSWKDAVQSVPPTQVMTAKSSHPSTAGSHAQRVQRHQEMKDRSEQSKSKKPMCQRAKLVRSRSIARVSESSIFRKRCEALQSHPNDRISPKYGCKKHGDAPMQRRQSTPSSPPRTFSSSSPSNVHANMTRMNPKGEESAKKSIETKQTCVVKAETTQKERNRPRQVVDTAGSEEDETNGVLKCRNHLSSAERMFLRRSSVPTYTSTQMCNSASTAENNHFDSNNDTEVSGVTCAEYESSDSQPSFHHQSLEEEHTFVESSPSSSTSNSVVSVDESEVSGLMKNCSLKNRGSRGRKMLDGEEDYSELDCDDTNSESTAESSCPSPRHSPVPHFGVQRQVGLTDLDMNYAQCAEEHDNLFDVMSYEEEQDEEAFMLLDRINNLSAEFMAHREYEESNALSWSVEHATRQGVISTQLQQNLHAHIRNGLLDEARDVLYHKCHLVPAVGSVIENPIQPALDSSVCQSFLDYLDEVSPTDAPEARAHKLHVLKMLSELLTKWVKMVGHERGLSEEHVALTSGSLFLAGSYRLGLDDPNSDIDAVCVVPWHVTNDDFFGSFCQLLEQTNGVTHLAPVPHAYVPLISLSFLGVSMDLLFARLPMSCVESHQEIDSDHLLVGVHPSSMKSLNAPRVSSMLLCLVPKRREFRIVLRAVRAWARRRGIYSAKLGYLGGISWAILVAFVCQLYPDAEPAKIFVRFFQVLSEWQWPQPVMLNMVYDAGLGFEMWDPRQNLYDRAHIMPIITPAYPHMNSAVQVSQSTFSVIYEEFWRARYLAEIAVGISRTLPNTASEPVEADMKAAIACMATSSPDIAESGDANVQVMTEGDQTTSSCPWEKLFQPSNFFIRYDSYIVVNFQADSPSSMHKWGKFVQSRLRKLVDSLQHVNPVSRVHAFPCYFPHTSSGNVPGSCMFIGIEFHTRRHNATAPTALLPKNDPEVRKNLEQTIRFFMATDLQQFEDKQPGMDADAQLLLWEDLHEFVFSCGRTVAATERAKYQEDLEKMGFSHNNTPSFRPMYFGNSYSRNGKWRGGPRKYAGGGKGKHPRRDDRFRDSSMSFPITQAG